jgi:hypothetical protein
MPEIDKINTLLPKNQKMFFHKTDSYYQLPNGSQLFLRGVEDRGESARGTFANGITCDEVGSWRDPDYVINEVLLPQLLTTGGQLVKISTPPQNLAHEWYRYKQEAIAENRFLQLTERDLTWLSEEEKDILARAMGGRNSSAWRREMLCEPIADADALIIPEYTEDRHDVEDYERPEYFAWYAGADFGFKDHTGILFGVVDFMRRELVIIDEIWVRAANSKDIADKAIAKERELFGDKVPYKRVADAPLQQIHDLQTLHGYAVTPAMKDDKYAAINSLRVAFNENRVKIAKNCKHLRFQLKVGMWNDRKTDFERGEGIGHLDLLAALIYLHRAIDWHFNPYPLYAPGIQQSTHWINEKDNNDQELARALFPHQKGK